MYRMDIKTLLNLFTDAKIEDYVNIVEHVTSKFNLIIIVLQFIILELWQSLGLQYHNR